VVGCGQNGLAEDKIFVANRKEWVITWRFSRTEFEELPSDLRK
jgi:hypothetical protein